MQELAKEYHTVAHCSGPFVQQADWPIGLYGIPQWLPVNFITAEAKALPREGASSLVKARVCVSTCRPVWQL